MLAVSREVLELANSSREDAEALSIGGDCVGEASRLEAPDSAGGFGFDTALAAMGVARPESASSGVFDSLRTPSTEVARCRMLIEADRCLSGRLTFISSVGDSKGVLLDLELVKRVGVVFAVSVGLLRFSADIEKYEVIADVGPEFECDDLMKSSVADFDRPRLGLGRGGGDSDKGMPRALSLLGESLGRSLKLS